MGSLRNIREKLGISQQEIAYWLGISRSLAEHYESGIRSLPANALIKLSKLEIVITAFDKEHAAVEKVNEKFFTAAPGENSNEERGQIHPRQAYEQEKNNKLYRQLALLKNKHSVLHMRMLLIQHLIDNSDEQTSEKENLWLQMVYHGTCYKMTKYDEAKQLPLKAKLLEIRVKEEIKNREAKN